MEPQTPRPRGYDIVGTVEWHGSYVLVDDAGVPWTQSELFGPAIERRVHFRIEYLERGGNPP